MRYSILFLFLFFFFHHSAKPQDECEMIEIEENYPSGLIYNGRYITSTGILKVLVIFVRFKDDYQSSSVWPFPTVLPTWAQNFVNTNYSATGNYFSETVSKYFYQNSYGNLHIIGDVKYASILVQNGVGLYSVKELLGHSSVSQTEVYAFHKSDLLHHEVSTLNNLLK